MPVIEITVILQTRRKFALSLQVLLVFSTMSQGMWKIFAFVFGVVFPFFSNPSVITVK